MIALGEQFTRQRNGNRSSFSQRNGVEPIGNLRHHRKLPFDVPGQKQDQFGPNPQLAVGKVLN